MNKAPRLVRGARAGLCGMQLFHRAACRRAGKEETLDSLRSPDGGERKERGKRRGAYLIYTRARAFLAGPFQG